MKNFEIWIDESGRFEEDALNVKKGHEPSLVGGAIVEKGTIGDNYLRTTFPKEVHCKDIKADEQIEYVKLVEGLPTLRNFIISNKQLIHFEDEKEKDFNYSYFILLAEGIIQAIKRLKAEYGAIHVDIIIATRVLNYQKITYKEFIEKQLEKDKAYLKQHLLLAGYRDGDITDEEWTITAEKAKDNPRLQVADIICNSYLTRNTKLKNYKEYMTEIFENPDKTLLFSLETERSVGIFYDMMSKGELGAAIFGISQCKNEKNIQNAMISLRKRLQIYPTELLSMHLDYIISQLQVLINDRQGKYTYSEMLNMIENIQKYFVEEMKSINSDMVKELKYEFSFDLEFLALTIYTHIGDLNKEREKIKICDNMLSNLLPTWKHTEKILKYQNRKLVHKMNTFEFEEAFKEFEQNRDKFSEIAEFMSLINEKEIKYAEYGKYLGTGVQLLQFQLRNQKELYEKATKLSDEAIEAFGDLPSKCRQYQYRVLIETDAKQFDKALEFLKKSLGKEETISNEEMIDEIGNQSFLIMHLLRLVSEGLMQEWELAESYFQLIQKKGIVNERIENCKQEHPDEIIAWKYATCWSTRGKNNSKATMKYYEKAIEASFQNKEYTIWLIGYAVLLEKYAFALRMEEKDCSMVKKDVIKYGNKIQKSEMPENMRKIFKDIDYEKTDWMYYYEWSRKITY